MKNMPFRWPGSHGRIAMVLLAVAALMATPPASFGYPDSIPVSYRETIWDQIQARDSNAVELTAGYVDLARRSGSDSILADAYHLRGMALRNEEDNMSSVPVFIEERRLRRKMKDYPGLAEADLSLGDAYRSIFDPDKAEVYLAEALSLFQQQNNLSGIGRTLNRQAALRIDFPFPPGREHGYELAERSLELAEVIGDYDLQVNNLILIGAYYRENGRFDQSLSSLRKAENLITLAGQKYHLSLVYGNLGATYYEMKEYKQAIDYQILAYQDAVRTGTRVYQWLGAYSLGNAYFSINEPDSGYKYRALGLQARVDIIDEVRTRQKAMLEEQFIKETYEHDLQSQFRQKKLVYIILGMAVLSAAIILFLFYSRNRRLSKINKVLLERNGLIEKQTEQLALLNREKDKVYAVIAHDLRSPFNSILGLSDLLSEEMKLAGKPELAKLAGTLHQTASRLYTLLENLLQWTQLQQGLITVNPVRQSLSDLFMECRNTLQDALQKKNIRFSMEVPENLVITTDPMMLGSILRNLVSNAVKFTTEGGSVSLTGSAPGGNQAEIRVSDSGIGMDADRIRELQLGIRANGRKGTNDEPSAGLGLLICQEFLKKLGGKMRIESELEKGATFIITLS